MQKQQFYADFAIQKHRKYAETRYSNNVRVVEQLVLAVLLQLSSNYLR